MHLSQFSFALSLAAAVFLNGSGILAADMRHDIDNGPVSHASVGHGGSRSVAVARPSITGNHQQFTAGAHSRGGSDMRQFSSRNLASVSPQHASQAVMPARRAISSPAADPRIARSQLAAQSTGSSRVLRASPVDQIDRRSTMLSSGSPTVRSSSSSTRPGVRSSTVTRYDRDHTDYRQRHEHHSPDWYRNNGWSEDSNYWRSHHHHRFFNDQLGVFIIDDFGPDYYPYGYGYDAGDVYATSEPMYLNSYAVDDQTAIAVQDALAQDGYYNGPIDGIIGPGTRAAITRYQEDAGLPVTGMIDDSLVRSLGLY